MGHVCVYQASENKIESEKKLPIEWRVHLRPPGVHCAVCVSDRRPAYRRANAPMAGSVNTRALQSREPAPGQIAPQPVCGGVQCVREAGGNRRVGGRSGGLGRPVSPLRTPRNRFAVPSERSSTSQQFDSGRAMQIASVSSACADTLAARYGRRGPSHRIGRSRRAYLLHRNCIQFGTAARARNAAAFKQA